MIGLIGLAGTPDGLGCPCAGTDGLSGSASCKAQAAALRSCHSKPSQPSCLPDKWGGPGVLSKKWLAGFTASCPAEAAAEAAAEASAGGGAGVPTWAWVLGGVAVVGVGAVLLLGGKKKYRSNRRDRRRTAGGLRHRRALRRRREREERELHGPKPRRPKYV